MKIIISLLLLAASASLYGQTPATIILGREHQLYSTILQEERKVWVHIPDDNSPDGVFEKQRYPVIYLLDGWEDNFSVVTAIASQLSAGGGNLSFPKMIVVGLPNTDRTRDLTPTKPATLPVGMDSLEASKAGGAEKFISFLQTELFPYIDSTYPTAPYKVFIGHSFGGLLVLYTLVHHTELFNAYVAIDPSTFWDDQLMLKQIKVAIREKSFETKSLYLALANSMNSGIDTSIIGPIMRCNFELQRVLEEDKKSKLIFSAKYFKEYNHQSVATPAEYDGFLSLFAFYNFNFPYQEFFQPTYKNDSLLSEHYKEISRRMGYKVSPPEDFINGIAHQLMSMNQLSRAHYFFAMNIQNHPASFNACLSMAGFFEKQGDKQKAIEFYQKSLSLHETAEGRQGLEKLLQKK